MAAFLRLDRLGELLVVGNDQSRDLLIVDDMFRTGRLVLEGSISMAQTFHRGPAYYHLLGLAHLLGGGHPIAGALLSVVLDLGALVVAYLLVRELSGSRVGGAVAAGLWAVAPILVHFGRLQWNPSAMPFFLLLALLGTVLVARGRGRWLLMVVPAWLLAWQMHEQALFALPLMGLLLLLHRRTWWERRTIAGAMGLGLLVLAPYLAQQVTHGFRDVVGMARYLLGGLLGAGPPPAIASPVDRIATAISGMTRALPAPAPLDLVVAGLAFGGLGWGAWRLWRGDRVAGVFLVGLALTPLLYAFWRAPFHGHYLLILYPIPLLLAGAAAGAVARGRPPASSMAVLGISTMVVALSALSVAAATAQTPIPQRAWAVRLAAARAIIAHAGGAPFAFRLISDQEPRDGWRATWAYAFRFAGTEPDPSRLDLPTYVGYEPADFGDGATAGGHVVGNARWVRYAAPVLGADLVPDDAAWGFEGRGRGAVAGTGPAREVQLSMDAPSTPIRASVEVPVSGGASYVLHVEHRAALVHGSGSIAVPLLDATGAVVTTQPSGGVHWPGTPPDWTHAWIRIEVPPEATRARIVLNAQGMGNVWFRSVSLHEIVRDDAPW